MSSSAASYKIVDDFIHDNHAEFYPEWLEVIPGDDEKGWGADNRVWYRDASSMIKAMASVVGHPIKADKIAIENLRHRSLRDFSSYLSAVGNIAGGIALLERLF